MVMGLLLVIYLLFGRIVPWSLAVTMTLFFGLNRKVWLGLVLVVLMGLLEDVVGIRTLGFSSSLLVGLLGIVWLVRRHYQGQWIWWYVLGIGGELIYRLATGALITWQPIVFQIAALWVIRWLVKRVGQPEGIYVGR